MNQKLSIVVPVFNNSQHLQECIDSILGQTYENLEVILVDDGSADVSGEICDAYEKKDDRVIAIHKNNEGPIKARLTGAEKASGEYLAFVDGDDWIDSNAYERMMSYMECCDAVLAGIFRYYGKNKIKTDIPMLKEGLYNRKMIEKKIIPFMLWSSKRNEWELDPSLCTKIFKKELALKFLRKASNLDIHFGDDTAVVFPLMLEAKSVMIMHRCYYYHRQREQNIVPSYFQNANFFEKLFSLYGYLKREFSKSAYWNVLQVQLEHFYINAVQLKQQCFLDYKEEKEDIFPFWDIPKGAKIILYGAGITGKRYFEQNDRYRFCEIVLWVDQNYQKLRQENESILSPECIFTASYDYLIIAIKSLELAQQIWEMLLEWNVPAEKIIWRGVAIQKIKIEKGEKISD